MNLIKDICRCASHHCNDLPFDQTSLLGKKIYQMNNVLRVKKKKNHVNLKKVTQNREVRDLRQIHQSHNSSTSGVRLPRSGLFEGPVRQLGVA